jgi:hypothetical protein
MNSVVIKLMVLIMWMLNVNPFFKLDNSSSFKSV